MRQETTLPPHDGKKYDHSLLRASTRIIPLPFSASSAASARTGGFTSVSKTSMSNPSRKCRTDSHIRPAFARSEYSSVLTGIPENLTALVTSSDTSNSAVSAVSLLITRQRSRNCRMYRRAQNGAVGSAARPNSPASTALSWPSPGGAQAEPGAGRVAAYLLSYDHPLSEPGWSGVTTQVGASSRLLPEVGCCL